LFTAVDLADIAKDLDSKELEAIAEGSGGIDSKDYKSASKAASNNYDDSGFFSIQVLTIALKSFNLDLVPFTSTEVGAAYPPELEKAFIINMNEHWRFGDKDKYWFNLNSTLEKPEHITPTYLTLYLQQIKNENGRIHAIRGEFPQSDSDLSALRGLSPETLLNPSDAPKDASGEDKELQMALDMSLREQSNSKNSQDTNSDDLKRAIELSLAGMEEEGVFVPRSSKSAGLMIEEDVDMNAAIAASFEGAKKVGEISIEDMRAARLAKMMPPDFKGKAT